MNRLVEQIPNTRLNEVGSAISRSKSIVREWLRRLDEKRRKRELDFSEEERRLERARIASELHDTLLQGFLAASLVVRATLEEMPEDSPGRASLNRAAHLMHGAIEEGRAVLENLRSPVVPSGSLERDFSDLLTEIVPAAGVEARVLVIGQPTALKREIQRQIYLIGREALVNALRHSTASSIEVELRYLRSRLHVVVRDNGCGIDDRLVRTDRASHLGLLGMCERAECIGAEVRIYSRPGTGTEVEISLPSGRAA